MVVGTTVIRSVASNAWYSTHGKLDGDWNDGDKLRKGCARRASLLTCAVSGLDTWTRGLYNGTR
jgi:hypothetical protein